MKATIHIRGNKEDRASLRYLIMKNFGNFAGMIHEEDPFWVRVVRTITYTGDPAWMKKQLGSSMPDGVRDVGPGKIEVKTISKEMLNEPNEEGHHTISIS